MRLTYLILLIVTGCAVNHRVWQTTDGRIAHEDKLLAAKEICNYDSKIAEVNETKKGGGFGSPGFSNDETRTVDYVNQRRITELEDEIEQCMRNQGLVLLPPPDNIQN